MNYKFNINKHRRICDLILVIFLLIMYLILGAIRISPKKFKYNRDYKEIDWTLFHPRSPESRVKDVTNPQPISKETNEVSMLGENLNFLEEIDDNELTVKKKRYDPLKVRSTESLNNEMDVIITDLANQLSDLDITNNKLQFSSKDFLRTENIAGPSIEIEESKNLNFDLYVDNKLNDIDKFSNIQDDKSIPDSDVIKLNLITDKLDDEDKDVSKFLHELILWMRKHQMQLPEVINKVMNYEQDDLTSKIKFEINDKLYELFLLCKENILEIKICLVEKDALIMLIDSGFKEKSNYLRRGEVKRNPNGTIALVWTRQEAPSKKSTAAFYQIFLSWWQRVKSEK